MHKTVNDCEQNFKRKSLSIIQVHWQCTYD